MSEKLKITKLENLAILETESQSKNITTFRNISVADFSRNSLSLRTTRKMNYTAECIGKIMGIYWCVDMEIQ